MRFIFMLITPEVSSVNTETDWLRRAAKTNKFKICFTPGNVISSLILSTFADFNNRSVALFISTA